MMLGLGVDMVDIGRIETLLKDFDAKFEARVFAPVEQEKAKASKAPAATYAKRFAAKEACAKALGTGFRDGLFLKDIVVENDAQGAPSLMLYGKAKEVLDALTPEGKTARVWLSLTDEPPYALAQVIITAD